MLYFEHHIQFYPMLISPTNWKSVVLLPVIIMAIAGCGQKETLLSDLDEDGGIYYHEGAPYSGIGFSNWTPERRKKTVEFKDGQIRRVVRYFQGDHVNHPVDSLIFNENRDLIYQKRWVNDTLSVEREGGDVYHPWSAYSMRFNPLHNLGDSLSPVRDKYRDVMSLLESEGNMSFEEFLDSLRLYYSFDHPFILDSLAPVFGSNNDQQRTFPEMLDALSDLHFSGAGMPQIDGLYKYPDDLYMYPIYGEYDNIDGVYLDLYCNDDRGVDYSTGRGRPKRTLTRMAVYTDYVSKSHPDYYEHVSNKFYLVDSIGPNSYRVFMRPEVMADVDFLNDEYRPLIFVVEMDFDPKRTFRQVASGLGSVSIASSFDHFNLSVHLFSNKILLDQHMTLAMEEKDHTNKYGRQSGFDRALADFQRVKIAAEAALKEPMNQGLRASFNRYYSGAQSGAGIDRESTAATADGADGSVDDSEFWIVVKQGKTNVNVRKTAPSGEVIGTVNGGDRLLASKAVQLSQGVYLLNREVVLTSLDGLRSFKRSANYQLQNVKTFSDHVEADIKDDNEQNVRVRVAINDVQPVNEEVWYYLPELGGYIFGGLVLRE